MMPNILQYPVCVFGALRAGCTVVNVNPLYTARELEHQLKDSGAEVLVVVENFAHTVAEVVGKTKVRQTVVTSIGELLGFKGLIVDFVLRHVKKMIPKYSLPGSIRLSDALAEGGKRTLERVDIGHDDIAFLQYTGGTTGVAKGAMLLHRNMVANMLQARAWVKPFLDPEPARGHHHAAAAVSHLLAHRELPRVHVGRRRERPDPEPARHPRVREGDGEVQVHRDHRRQHAVQRAGEQRRISPSSTSRRCGSRSGGGMAVQEAVALKWKEVTGTPLIEAYGLTETSPAATINPLDLAAYNGSIGLPISSTEVVLRDDAGKEVPLGQPGEICIRGPQVMAGYWQRPDETAKVMDKDGWFATGDVGVMDERGFVRIVDRKKDMILVSGFNVYPNEIEGVVAAHPGVLECAAVGVPDKKSGEAVKLFVVKKDPALTAEQVIAYCREHLTGYKCPREVEFRTELPKTNVGKILRRELRDEQKKAA